MQRQFMYIHLVPGDPLPKIFGNSDFKAAIVLREPVSVEWQQKVSKWLVESGCKYGCSWGVNCSSWDDSIDLAAIEIGEKCENDRELLVMTTWHQNESISEFFDFVKRLAVHPNLDLQDLVVVEISINSNKNRLMQAYA